MMETIDGMAPLEILVDQILGRESRARFGPLFAPLSRDLQDVGAKMAEVLPSSYPFLTEAATYAGSSGGKLLRPLIILVAYRALGFEDTAPVHALAASVQLIHTASLVHDDVIDHAELRRGRPSVQKAFGEHTAIVTGDYLFVRAFQLAASYPKQVILKCGEASADLAQGEVMQSNSRHDVTVDRERYLRIVSFKTANAIAAGAAATGMVADADLEVTVSLSDYGRALGIAFQFQDDLLDIYGDPEVTGKPLYSDFKEGMPTLPSVIAYERLAGREKEEFEELFTNPGKRNSHLLRMRELIDSVGAREATQEEALRWSRAAVAALKVLPPGPYRDLLEKIAVGAVERCV